MKYQGASDIHATLPYAQILDRKADYVDVAGGGVVLVAGGGVAGVGGSTGAVSVFGLSSRSGAGDSALSPERAEVSCADWVGSSSLGW